MQPCHQTYISNWGNGLISFDLKRKLQRSTPLQEAYHLPAGDMVQTVFHCLQGLVAAAMALALGRVRRVKPRTARPPA